MNRLLPLCLMALLSPMLLRGEAEEATATVIEMGGEALVEAEAGAFKPLELGQLLVVGDHLKTLDDSSVQMILADGSTLSLGPNSEFIILQMSPAAEPSRSLYELTSGSLYAIVEKLKSGASFEVRGTHALATAKGTQFEFSTDPAESRITVDEGHVAVSDPMRRKSVDVGPLSSCSASLNRLNSAFHLSKREALDFRERWARNRMIHGQRLELMKAFDSHLVERRAALNARREILRQRVKNIQDQGGESSGEGKKELQDRRKAARERFEKARAQMEKRP